MSSDLTHLHDIEIEFESASPFKPFNQLMAVQPASGFVLVKVKTRAWVRVMISIATQSEAMQLCCVSTAFQSLRLSVYLISYFSYI